MLHWENGIGSGNYYNVGGMLGMLGLYWDNGKEHGNYYNVGGMLGSYTGIMEKKMETTILGLLNTSHGSKRNVLYFGLGIRIHSSESKCAFP